MDTLTGVAGGAVDLGGGWTSPDAAGSGRGAAGDSGFSSIGDPNLSRGGDLILSSAGDPNLSPRPMSTPPLPAGVAMAGGTDGSRCVAGASNRSPIGDLPGVGSIGAGEGSSTAAMRPCGTRMGDCFDLGAVSGGVEATGDVASFSLCAMVGLSVEAGGDLGDRRGDLLAVFGL